MASAPIILEDFEVNMIVSAFKVVDPHNLYNLNLRNRILADFLAHIKKAEAEKKAEVPEVPEVPEETPEKLPEKKNKA